MPSFGKMPESVLARNRRGGVASSGLMTKQGPESTTPAHTCIGRSRLRKAARMVIAPPMLCPTKKRGSDRHVDGMGLPTPLPPEITVSTYKSKSSVRHQCHHNRAHVRVDGNIETKQFSRLFLETQQGNIFGHGVCIKLFFCQGTGNSTRRCPRTLDWPIRNIICCVRLSTMRVESVGG